MKRILLSVLAGVAVFGAVFGFAAAITPTSDNLGAGDADVNACTSEATAAVTTSYNNVYDSTDGRYEVDSVTVSGIPAACDNHRIGVTLTGASNANLADGHSTTGTGGSVTIPMSGKAASSAVTDVHVLISSGASTGPESN